MLIFLDNPKKGDKLEVTREYLFDKGTYTETRTIVTVLKNKIILDDGDSFHYFQRKEQA